MGMIIKENLDMGNFKSIRISLVGTRYTNIYKTKTTKEIVTFYSQSSELESTCAIAKSIRINSKLLMSRKSFVLVLCTINMFDDK